MSLIPFWLKLLVAGIMIAAVLAAIHFWKESLREEGRTEVRVEWAAANAAAEKLATAAARRAEVDAAARDAQRDKDFGTLKFRNAALAARLAAACVDADVVAGMRESIRAANHEPSAASPSPSAAPVARAPTGLELDDWFQSVAKLYSRCRDQVIGWIEWDDNRSKQR